MARAVVIARRTTKVDTIDIDSCLEENHTLANTVTDHPVEEGVNITDHVRPNPDTVQLRCFVSNTPLSTEQRARAIRAGDVDFRTTAETGTEIGATDGRGANAYARLKKLRNEGSFIEVVTTLCTYGTTANEGMVIENLGIPRSKENYDGLEFVLQLKQIKIVRNRRTTDRRQKEKHTRKEKKEGQKPVQKKNKSRLATGYDQSNGDTIGTITGALGFGGGG